MYIKEEIKEITKEDKRELESNSDMYLGVAFIIKSYMKNHNKKCFNQRLIDIGFYVWFKYDCYKFCYDYDIDELINSFEYEKKEHKIKSYKLIEEYYQKLRLSDCGYCPFWNKNTRFQRVGNLLKYDIDILSKYFFLSLVYTLYINSDIFDETFYITNEEILNDMLYKGSNLYSCYIDDKTFTIEEIQEYISNCQFDDFYTETFSINKCHELHLQFKYLNYTGAYILENNGLLYNIDTNIYELYDLSERIKEEKKFYRY